MARVSASPEYNLHAIATAAGSSDFHYDPGELVCNDIDQAALDLALANYDHAAEMAKPTKIKGFRYNGVDVPVTNEDAMGALQMKAGFESFGLASTNFHLSNGQVLPITAAEWPAFAAAFFACRAQFF